MSPATALLLTRTLFTISALWFTVNYEILPKPFKWSRQISQVLTEKEENDTVRWCSHNRCYIMKHSLCLSRVCFKFRIKIAGIFQQQTIDPACIISWMTHHRGVLLNIDHSLDWTLQSTLPRSFPLPFWRNWKKGECVTHIVSSFLFKFISRCQKRTFEMHLCSTVSLLPLTEFIEPLCLVMDALYLTKGRISVLFIFSLFVFHPLNNYTLSIFDFLLSSLGCSHEAPPIWLLLTQVVNNSEQGHKSW